MKNIVLIQIANRLEETLVILIKCESIYVRIKYTSTFINQHDFNNRVKRDIDHVGAAAVDSAVSRPVVSVAEKVWRQLMHLGERRRWWSTV